MTLSAQYFDKLYQENKDPWNFEQSDYEREKYSKTVNALPRALYDNAFEIGCSIGVLTQRLASRCHKLLSVDVSELPLTAARDRLKGHSHVEFKCMNIPSTFPEDRFDLIVVSEVGYYWSQPDLEKAQQKIMKSLLPGGHLLLVHWTPVVNDYPLLGDEVHDAFDSYATVTKQLTRLYHHRAEKYRLDLWEAVPK
ncbi:MAG: SAM-dependent methyltransferase [Tunicatimonas sp.]|uniref:class I SAM-dependent DNA methyltransferase n=1 Tax=Tunicatimonas sp. TaxID=1940096 RepID=UPI003C75A1E2